MLQKFKITSYAFTVSCAVFMSLPVNTSAQNDSNVQSRVVDLEGAVFSLQNLNERMSDTIEKMSDTITELESKLAVSEEIWKLREKVEKTEEGLSTLVKWTGTDVVNGGEMAVLGEAIRKRQKEERQEEHDQLLKKGEMADLLKMLVEKVELNVKDVDELQRVVKFLTLQQTRQ